MWALLLDQKELPHLNISLTLASSLKYCPAGKSNLGAFSAPEENTLTPSLNDKKERCKSPLYWDREGVQVG